MKCVLLFISALSLLVAPPGRAGLILPVATGYSGTSLGAGGAVDTGFTITLDDDIPAPSPGCTPGSPCAAYVATETSNLLEHRVPDLRLVQRSKQ